MCLEDKGLKDGEKDPYPFPLMELRGMVCLFADYVPDLWVT